MKTRLKPFDINGVNLYCFYYWRRDSDFYCLNCRRRDLGNDFHLFDYRGRDPNFYCFNYRRRDLGDDFHLFDYRGRHFHRDIGDAR